VCNFDVDCPDGGACITAQFICQGGGRDGESCECPGSSCDVNHCSGGPRINSPCNVANDCPGGACVETANVCLGGELAGEACVTTAQCGGTLFFCLGNGRFCWGGDRFKLGCVDDENCAPGTCTAPSSELAPTLELCSGGSQDGDECDSHAECPGGACVIGQTVCHGGATRDGVFCQRDTDCDPGSSCASTQKLCSGGDADGLPCFDNASCTGGGQCVSTGKFCDEDLETFPCIDDDQCLGGANCVSPEVGAPEPTPVPASDDNDSCAVNPTGSRTSAGLVLSLLAAATLLRRGRSSARPKK
jgi:hypothetical protein